MTGAEYIVEFFRQRGSKNFFLVTGGACAFIIDAVGRNAGVNYYCFQHEQSTAMAADASWRVNRTAGVTIATSGPGATNLITGIASSYFDSIPAIHITGQVNKLESSAFLGAKVRQAGFQETNIVDMVKPITKYAVQVNSIKELKEELIKAYNIAVSHRMGPVLIDVPMNIQKDDAGELIEYRENSADSPVPDQSALSSHEKMIAELLQVSERPVVLLGAGLGLAEVSDQVVEFLEKHNLPFVSSWSGMSFFNHDSKNYFGQIGVYGNRGANAILQNCDGLLVLGSRLDNRQRSGNSKSFAPESKVLVVDIDQEELKKYAGDGYGTVNLDLRFLPSILKNIKAKAPAKEWLEYTSEMKSSYFGKDLSTYSKKHNSMSPYKAVMRINELMNKDAIVAADTGATVCWIYQSFHRTAQNLFTSAGNSPMGYALPAAIGAKIICPDKQVFCLTGDGGFQMNLQELQTVVHYKLDVKIVIFNNSGYGIIKQFQDSYLDSRYTATGKGYSVPDFGKIAKAYGIEYIKINRPEQLNDECINKPGAIIIDLILDENTWIEPKLEMGRPIHDQFPYVTDQEYSRMNRFSKKQRMK